MERSRGEGEARFTDSGTNAGMVESALMQLFGLAGVVDEAVGQTKLQQRFNDAMSGQQFGDGRTGPALNLALFDRDEELVVGQKL